MNLSVLSFTCSYKKFERERKQLDKTWVRDIHYIYLYFLLHLQGQTCLKRIFSFSFLFHNSIYVLPKLRYLKRKEEKIPKTNSSNENRSNTSGL